MLCMQAASPAPAEPEVASLRLQRGISWAQRGDYLQAIAAARSAQRALDMPTRGRLPRARAVRGRRRVKIQADRNPQTLVPNIFWAKPGDYRKATQRVYHADKHSSFIELPLAATTASARAPASSAMPSPHFSSANLLQGSLFLLRRSKFALGPGADLAQTQGRR
jgi:hypothetical protein